MSTICRRITNVHSVECLHGVYKSTQLYVLTSFPETGKPVVRSFSFCEECLTCEHTMLIFKHISRNLFLLLVYTFPHLGYVAKAGLINSQLQVLNNNIITACKRLKVDTIYVYITLIKQTSTDKTPCV